MSVKLGRPRFWPLRDRGARTPVLVGNAYGVNSQSGFVSPCGPQGAVIGVGPLRAAPRDGESSAAASPVMDDAL